MTTASTPTSRLVFVHDTQTFDKFKFRGAGGGFVVDPPVTCKRGHYRVELNFEARTATFTLIALSPEEDA